MKIKDSIYGHYRDDDIDVGQSDDLRRAWRLCKHDKIPGEGCARKDCLEAPAAQRQWVGLMEPAAKELADTVLDLEMASQHVLEHVKEQS